MMHMGGEHISKSYGLHDIILGEEENHSCRQAANSLQNAAAKTMRI